MKRRGQIWLCDNEESTPQTSRPTCTHEPLASSIPRSRCHTVAYVLTMLSYPLWILRQLLIPILLLSFRSSTVAVREEESKLGVVLAAARPDSFFGHSHPSTLRSRAFLLSLSVSRICCLSVPNFSCFGSRILEEFRILESFNRMLTMI